MTIDVIIPVYKPGNTLKKLIKTLEHQTCQIQKIWLMHTEDGADLSWVKEASIPVEEILIPKDAYDHGGTRNIAMSHSQADVVVCMTQDAVAANRCLIEKLLEALNQEPEVAVAYARQVAGQGADLLETYTRTFNYPDTSKVKTKDDIEQMGIKAFFCSNVCAAYKREIFEKLGGFESPIIFNEDMIYAAKALENGFKVAYAAEAVVRHSHNYSALEQLKRNFDLGVSQSCYPEIFEHISSEKEGIRLILETAGKLIRAKKPMKIVKLGVHSISKYMGYRLGRNYKKLPKSCIRMLTTNPAYWMKEE